MQAKYQHDFTITSPSAQPRLHGLHHLVHLVKELLPLQVELGGHLVGLEAHPVGQLQVGHVEVDPESRDDVVVAVKHLQGLLQEILHLVDVLDPDGVDLDEEVLDQFVDGFSVCL